MRSTKISWSFVFAVQLFCYHLDHTFVVDESLYGDLSDFILLVMYSFARMLRNIRYIVQLTSIWII